MGIPGVESSNHYFSHSEENYCELSAVSSLSEPRAIYRYFLDIHWSAVFQFFLFTLSSLQALKREVAIMVEMVRCLDAYSGQQTRLVMVVDGLDSCEQDQVLYVLDAVHLLFTEQSSPFITLLAIDPHIIIKVFQLR